MHSTIKLLCTLLVPSSGTATVNGYDVMCQASQVRQNLGAANGGVGNDLLIRIWMLK